MRIIHRLLLFVILAMTLIFTEPILVTGQGWWGYSYNSPYYYSQADFEQYMWDMEANYFMNSYDPAYQPYLPAYSHPFYGNPAYYIPKYTAAPTYTFSPTPTTPTYTPSSGTFQYNQATGYGSASYWLNEANVSYFAGSYEQAANSYAKAVNLDPSLKIGWLNLGNSLYLLGRYQASSDAYNETLKLDSLNADAMIGKGKDLMALNKKI